MNACQEWTNKTSVEVYSIIDDEINIWDLCCMAGIDSKSISAGRTESHLEMCEAYADDDDDDDL